MVDFVFLSIYSLLNEKTRLSAYILEMRTCKVLGKCRIEKRIKYKHVAGVLTILAWGETIKIQNNWITKAIGTTVHFVKWLIYFSYQFVHSSKKRQGNQPIYRHVQNRTYIA